MKLPTLWQERSNEKLAESISETGCARMEGATRGVHKAIICKQIIAEIKQKRAQGGCLGTKSRRKT